MAFAIVAGSVKVYPLKQHLALQTKFAHTVEVSLTAANTDTAVALGTIASALSTDEGKALTEALNRTQAVLGVFVDVSARVATAAGASHALDVSTPSNPTLTFAGGGTTPVAFKVVLQLAARTDAIPVVYGV